MQSFSIVAGNIVLLTELCYILGPNVEYRVSTFGDIVENSSDTKHFWFIKVSANSAAAWKSLFAFEKVVNMLH